MATTRDAAKQQVRDKFAAAAEAVINLNDVTYAELDRLTQSWETRFNEAVRNADNMSKEQRTAVAQAAADEAEALNEAREAKDAGDEERAREARDRAIVARDEFTELVTRVANLERRIGAFENSRPNPAPAPAASPRTATDTHEHSRVAYSQPREWRQTIVSPFHFRSAIVAGIFFFLMAWLGFSLLTIMEWKTAWVPALIIGGGVFIATGYVSGYAQRRRLEQSHS